MIKGRNAFSSPLLRERLRKPQALIEEGFRQLQLGKLESAKVQLEGALALISEHPTALQLLGLIEKQTGRHERARALMQRSLEINPNQPHVWNNFSNVLLELGLIQQALAAVCEALRLDQHYVDALLNRAKLFLQLDDCEKALVDINDGISAGKKLVQFSLLKAQVHEKQGLMPEAEACLRLAIERDPSEGLLHHNLAVILHRTNRHEESLIAHQRAKRLGLENADSLYNLGNTLQSLGELEQACEAYESACSRDPGHLLAQADLARLRWRLEDPQWHRTLMGALQHPSQQANAKLLGQFAHLLWKAGHVEDALETWQRAEVLEPDQVQWKDAVGRCLVRLGHLEEGLRKQRKALATEETAALHASLATSLIIAGEFDQANLHASQSCSLEPLDQYAWAIQELCWRGLGDTRHAWLFNPDLLIHVEDLQPPIGWHETQCFNRELEQALLSMHQDRQAPIDQTLRHGTQTFGNLFERSNSHVNALVVQLECSINRFIKSLTQDAKHPFLGRIGSSIKFETSWSTRLHSNGFHTNHVHPAGWLSLAYYVSVPTACRDKKNKQGWLQFGQPESSMPSTLASLRLIEPKVGRLVLFPSYFWHGTTMFDQPQYRMAISADILPIL